MTEQNQVPQPPAPPPPPQQPEGGADELQKVRKGNLILKIVAGVLAFLFLLTAGSAIYVYRKVTRAKAALDEAFNSLPPPVRAGGEGAAMPQSGFAMFGSGQQGGQSSLGLVTGGVPGALPGGMTAEDGERIYNALRKYEQRPIVQEFIADLKKNPDMAKAFAEAGSGPKANPFSVISSIRNARGMEALVAKYIYRPEFMTLMTDVMKDPDLRGMMGGVAGMMPAQPRGGPAPASARPTAPEDAAPAGGDEPMTLDQSVISGQAGQPASKPRAGRAPPPVDSD